MMSNAELRIRNRLPAAAGREEGGFALILVLLCVVLLYVLVAETVLRSGYDRMSADNQAVDVQLRKTVRLALVEALQELVDDLADEGEEEAAGGAAGGLGALGGGGAPAGGAGGEGEEESSAPKGDHSRDTWFKPKSFYDDNDVSVYGWIVDENRKLNLLTLLSKDEEFAKASMERYVRVLDEIWDNTDEDLSGADAEAIARGTLEMMKGFGRTDARPRPPLKTDKDGEETSIPLALDDLKLVPQFKAEYLDDRFIQGGIHLPGLRSVLTVYTALSQTGSGEGGEAGAGGGDAGAAGGEESPTPNNETSTGSGGSEGELLGPGVRININTVPPALLRSLANPADIPEAVIDAILEYRNTVDEEARDAAEAAAEESGDAGLLANDGTQTDMLQLFETLDDLDNVDEWDTLPNSDGKKDLNALLTTQSHVFTIHLAVVHKRNQSGTAFSLQRFRAVYIRLDGGDEPKMQVLVPLHRVSGMRVAMPDFSEEDGFLSGDVDLSGEEDPYMAEEQAWNPFLLDFYDPERRNRFGEDG
jgi:hypothetical protein